MKYTFGTFSTMVVLTLVGLLSSLAVTRNSIVTASSLVPRQSVAGAESRQSRLLASPLSNGASGGYNNLGK